MLEKEELSRTIPPTSLTMKEALAIIDKLAPQSSCRYEWQKLRHLISTLLSGQLAVFSDLPAMPMFRGRIVRVKNPGSYTPYPSGTFLNNVSLIGPRSPEDTDDYGRCHLPKSSVFYGAFNLDTVLAEIRPEIGDLVYVLRCEPVADSKFLSCTIGEIDHVRRYGRGSIMSEGSRGIQEIKRWLAQASTESDYVRIVTDAFLARYLSRPCSDVEDYRAVSALAGVVLRHRVEYPGNVEALYYPSVAHAGGMNIAIPYDSYRSKVRPVSCGILQVLNNFGYGVYKTRFINESESIDSEGNIQWKPGGRKVGIELVDRQIEL